MKEWIFPSLTFFAFLYFIFFLWFYIYTYSQSEVETFSKIDPINNQDNISVFLKEIAKSFKSY